MRRTLIASFVIVALASAGWLASTGRGDASHSWGSYHWARTANPFTLTVVDSTTQPWDAYRLEAQADWSASTVLDLTTGATDESSSTRRRCPMVSGQIRACNQTYGNNGWLGLATIKISGSHIISGSAKVNDTYFNSPSYTPAWKRLVMCQEIAHAFGLGHVNVNYDPPNTGSCMDYTNDADGGEVYGPSNEHPNAHDFEQLALIYAHLDTTATLKSTTTSDGPGNGKAGVPAGADMPTDALPDGATARDGRVFSRDLGDGTRLISVVIWEEDFRGAAAPGRNSH